MKIGVFGGSFDPIQKEHKKLAEEAIKALSLEKLIVVPAYIPPFKETKTLAEFTDRVEMVKLAFKNVNKVEVSMLEYNPKSANYTYLTLKEIKKEYPDDTIYLIFGEDCLLSFERWKNPAEIVKVAKIATFIRTNSSESKGEIKKKYKTFLQECEALSKQFNVEVIPMKYVSENISSTGVRVASAFNIGLEKYVEREVADYIYARKLYTLPKVSKALTYLKKTRQIHTYGVAKMATSVASKYNLDEEKVILASGMHDVAKYLEDDRSELANFDFKQYASVPKQVLHQFTGEYVARTILGETDEDVLNAIKYHTSGRPNMSILEKIVFLSDMLEDGRDFPCVKKLRKLFYKDIDLCLYEALKHQIKYLKSTKSEIYSLTNEAYEYIKTEINNRKLEGNK